MSSKLETGGPLLNRRNFVSGLAAGGALVTTGVLVSARPAEAESRSPSRSPSDGANRGAAFDRADEAFGRRYDAAARQRRRSDAGAITTNGDEDRYSDLRGSFCKTLPQNEFGEVDPDVYRALIRALESGDPEVLETVALSPISDRGLANPLGAHAFEMLGPDSWSLRLPPAPAFASATSAAEMGEIYWQAITRDVPFRHYGSDSSIASAAADLNTFSVTLGPDDSIGIDTLFRGETEGDVVGPYLSQFLWLPAAWGLATLDQRYALPLPGQAFGIDRAEWLAVQRGANPDRSTVSGDARYLATGRDLAEYVHGDVSYQAYLTAALILLGMGEDAIDPQIPYRDSANQVGFVTLGAPEIVDLVAKAAHAALKAAWFQKWLVHRRLRPEVFAARAEFQAKGEREYGIHADLFESRAAAALHESQGNLLLPLAFPEGSPTHPAYPAGHAAIAGACATMLKAVFDEHFELPEPVEANATGSGLDPWTGEALTLGNEVNKLASNITLGRDTAGVHYRSDGIEGMNLGEEVALGILGDYARTRAEDFDGFELTRFDGTSVLVSGDGVRSRRDGRPRRAPRRRETS